MMSSISELFEEFQYPCWIKNKQNNTIHINKVFKSTFNQSNKEVKELLYNIERIKEKSTEIANINNKTYKHIIFNNKDEEIIGILVDFPEEVKSKDENYEKHTLRTVIDTIPDLIFYKDKDLKYLGVNKKCEKFYNDMGVTEILGKNDLELPIDLSLSTQCYEHDNIVISKKQTLHIEENTDDKIYETVKTPIIDEFGNIKGLVGVVRDITDYKIKEKMLTQLSYTDGLTSLFNRTYFDKKVEEIIENKKFPMGLILGDVNGLKLVNDTLGHLRGDKLLKCMAKILKKATNEVGTVFRWGGDEFVILLPGLSHMECARMMQKIDDICENTICGGIKTSISMGYSILDEGDSIDKVLVEAEDKVYKKKMLSGSSVRASMLETLKMNLENKNVETEKHTQRVADFCIDIAKELNLDEETVEKASLIGKLHDIGKIGISEHILLKPEKLTDDEYEIMKTHSEKGYRLASLLPEISCISREILTHHERWDGLGYPLGLSKDEIPILSRIVAVADSFDAMTNDRCYSEARSIQDSLNELKRCSGTQFDPQIVEVFINIIEKQKNPS